MDLSSYFEPIDTSVVDYHHVEFHTLLGDCIRAHTAADLRII